MVQVISTAGILREAYTDISALDLFAPPDGVPRQGPTGTVSKVKEAKPSQEKLDAMMRKVEQEVPLFSEDDRWW